MQVLICFNTKSYLQLNKGSYFINSVNIPGIFSFEKVKIIMI